MSLKAESLEWTAPPAGRGSAPALQCLLCGASQLEVANAFRCDHLRKAWNLFGVTLSAQAWSMFDGIEEVRLFRCAQCGFEFCDPRLAGGGEFYAELERQKSIYYPAEVPEFVRTLRWARERNLRSVLDIGCGAGAFLDLASGAGLAATGLELNLQAAETCRRKGHTVHTCSAEELLADAAGPRFDLVTLFQVLEHVSQPVLFLRQAAQFLKPGGCLSVAVPNANGIYRICPKEPHQWPPHHITRWRLSDLRRLGSLCELDVVQASSNRLYGCELEHFWKLRNQIATATESARLPGGDLLPALLSWCYRKLGLRFLVPGFGTSVYAFYQKRPT